MYDIMNSKSNKEMPLANDSQPTDIIRNSSFKAQGELNKYMFCPL